MNVNGHLCATCGYRQLKLPQRTSSGAASHEICPSCGYEPGFTDDEQDITPAQWRERWVAGGCQWTAKGKSRPKNWNPIKDLHSLLRRKRPVHPPVIRREPASEESERPAAKKTALAAKKKSAKK